MAMIVGSTVLGLAAAEANQRILRHEPIFLELNPEVARALPLTQILKITYLGTVGWDDTRQFPPDFASKEEFRQGDILGILLNYTYTCKNPQNAEIWKSVGENEEEFVYYGEILVSYFKISIGLYDSQGNLVANTSDMKILRGGGRSDHLVNITNNSMYRGYYMLVSYSWVPGYYTIKASVKELLTGLTDTSEATVYFTVGPIPEAPNPISVHTRLMILGSEDMPEGWVVAVQDPNQTTLEGYAMSVGFYTKPAGDFEKQIQLEVIQFSNIEAATQNFESRLEGMLLTEKYGHVKVTMLELGDSGFLADFSERRDPSWSGWDGSTSYASGSGVVFRKDNLVAIAVGIYEFEAIKQDIYVTNEELIEFAGIQAAKILAVAEIGE